jgi:hypothetical protein
VTSDGLADSVSSHVKKRRECESGLPRGGVVLDFDDVEASSGFFVESCKSPPAKFRSCGAFGGWGPLPVSPGSR